MFYKINPPILTREYCVMKDFQDHIIEPVPLLIKERPWVEINSTRLAGSTEQHKEGGVVDNSSPIQSLFVGRCHLALASLHLSSAHLCTLKAAKRIFQSSWQTL
jgi:hypothetical protein